MPRFLFKTLALALAFHGGAIGAQSKGLECPVERMDTSRWKVAKEGDIGIEMKYPADYVEKHWESRSDTMGADFELRWRAAKIVEFHQIRGWWIDQGPNTSVAPCRVQTRSGVLTLYLERARRTLWTGQDTVYFVAKGIFTPPGKRQTLVRLNAPDSAGFLEQIAMLRTLRFLGSP